MRLYKSEWKYAYIDAKSFHRCVYEKEFLYGKSPLCFADLRIRAKRKHSSQIAFALTDKFVIWSAHCSQLADEKGKQLVLSTHPVAKITEATHPYYRRVVHRRSPHCRHRRRPLILWLQHRGVHDEVLAVDQSDWALFSIWAQSLPLQHITR